MERSARRERGWHAVAVRWATALAGLLAAASPQLDELAALEH
jgi:hypothetical protein